MPIILFDTVLYSSPCNALDANLTCKVPEHDYVQIPVSLQIANTLHDVALQFANDIALLALVSKYRYMHELRL